MGAWTDGAGCSGSCGVHRAPDPLPLETLQALQEGGATPPRSQVVVQEQAGRHGCPCCRCNPDSKTGWSVTPAASPGGSAARRLLQRVALQVLQPGVDGPKLRAQQRQVRAGPVAPLLQPGHAR